MKVHKIEVDCYEVTEPDFGGTVVEHVAYFSTKQLAEQFVQDSNKNWPKHIGKISKIIEYNICESLEDYKTLEQEIKLKAALRKLTDEEKKLLGLS